MEERKFATVLFADFVDSTALGGQHDPEVVRAAFAVTFARMREILVAHGGTVEKFIGDAVMAVFGVPNAHEDDALRAVRAAFALREALALQATASPISLALRVGVNTGEVVTGAGAGRDFLVTGQPVNMGARLQSASEPGQILVGALTRKLTAGSVRYGPALAIEAKGLGRVEGWPVLELLAEPIVRVVRSVSLVDREAELRLLLDTHERARAEGSPYLVTIFGAPGVGKSRLADEFVSRAGIRGVRRGRCVAYGEGVTFAPLQSILRADAGVTEADGADEATRRLRSAVHAAFGADRAEADRAMRRLEVLAGLATVQAALSDVPQESVAQELDWALRRYLEQRTADLPLVLVFEDVHWAEPALLDTIEHLAEWTRGSLFIICLARPEFLERRRSWGGGRANAVTLPVRPLSLDQTRELVVALLSADRAPASEEIVQRSEGNPLYAEELVRHLVESGEPPSAVPATLHGLIAARLDAADRAVKALLQRASVIGRVFWTDALSALGEDPASMRAGLLAAIHHDFIVELRERGSGGGWGYRFSHALTRDVAYASLAKSERALLHDRLGRWLEAAGAERRVEDGDIVAFHAEQAYLLAREVGIDRSAELGRRAFVLLLSASRAALIRADYRGSQGLFQRATLVGETSGADPLLLLEARGRAAIARLRLEGSPEALADVDRALAEARPHGASPVLAGLLQWSAMYALSSAPDLARSLNDEAVSAARVVGDPVLLAGVLRGSARPAASRGDLSAERRVLIEARELLGGSDDRQMLPRVLLDLASNAIRGGEFTSGRRHLDEAIPLAQDVVGRVLANRSDAEFWSAVGDLDRAQARAERALVAARELGSPFAIATAADVLGGVLRERGEAERSRAVLDEALLTAGGRTAGVKELAQLRCQLARTCLALGDVRSARLHAADAASVRVTEVAGAAAAMSTLAMVTAAEGSLERASALFRESLGLLEPTGLALELALVRLEWSRILIATGRGAEGRPHLERVRKFYADPLAARRRTETDALIQQLDEAAVG